VLGHDAGDQVAVRPEDTVARLGSNEFTIVASVQDQSGAAALLSRLETTLAEPLYVEGTAHAVALTLGAALADPGDDPRAAVARADRAMYARKPVRASGGPAQPARS
jgi:diguanylate cyclase (GGDEF)-like protein